MSTEPKPPAEADAAEDGRGGKRLIVRGRYLPPIVLAFTVVQVFGSANGLSGDTKLSHHLVLLAVFLVVVLLWFAALVVWRQRWAWWLWVIVYTIALVSPAWQKSPAGISYAVDVLTLGLLVSTPMRRYLGIRRRQPTATNA